MKHYEVDRDKFLEWLEGIFKVRIVGEEDLPKNYGDIERLHREDGQIALLTHIEEASRLIEEAKKKEGKE